MLLHQLLSTALLSTFLATYQQGHTGTFTGKDGVPISYYTLSPPAPRASIVMLNGYSEAYVMYAELFQELYDAGYAIYTFDHRGQGASGRMLPDPQIGYVREFGDFVDDTATFMDQIVRPAAKGPLLFLSHSTGGLIGARYIATHPGVFSRAVMSAPFFQLNTHQLSEFLAYTVVSFLCGAGRCERYGPTQGTFDPETYRFEDNVLTHSRPRFEYMTGTVRQDPRLLIRGASSGWLRQTIGSSLGMASVAKDLKLPLLIFQAGDDQYVLPERQRAACSAAPDCKIVALPGSFHEILLEDDRFRQVAVDGLLAFLKMASPP